MSELDNSPDRKRYFTNTLKACNTIFNILMFLLGFVFLYGYLFVNSDFTRTTAMLIFSVLFCYISLHVYLMNKIINSQLY